MNRLKIYVFSVLLCFSAVLYPEIAESRTLYVGSSPETIKISYTDETIIKFEKPVKTISGATKFIIKTADENSPDFSTLIVRPRALTATGNVVFLLNDGSTLRLRLITAKDLKDTETYYQIKSKEDLIEQKDTGDLPEIGKVDLMKAMIKGDKVLGYEIKELSKSLDTGLKGVTGELTRAYVGPDYVGYIFRLTNTTTVTKYSIDIRKLKLGNPNLAIFSEIDRTVLEPEKTGRHTATLIVLAKPASFYKDIVLPVRNITQK